jgi:hypothetical protein
MSRCVFYNAGPQQSRTRPGSASRDLGGLLREYHPRAAIAVEVVGDQLAPHPGYALVRDTSTPARANVCAYLREDCQLRRTWWIDHRTRWHRTEHDQHELHPPRSSLVMGVGQLQLLGAHNVPLGTDATHEGQLELVQALHLVMAPWKRPRIRDRAPELSLEAMKARPRLLLWDDNAPAGTQGLGADYLAPKVQGQRHGARIDNAVARQLPGARAEYVWHAGGVQLATDHPWGALVLHLPKGSVAW